MSAIQLSDSVCSQAIQALKDCSGNKTEAARLLGLSRETYRARLNVALARQGAAPPAAPQRTETPPQAPIVRIQTLEPPTIHTQPQQAPIGRTLAEFRNTYDKDHIIPKKIKEGLAQLGNGWEYETVFGKLIGVGLADIGKYRELFADHIVTISRENKRAWAGTAGLAKQMREMI